ncbi:MAG: lysoplasmalogenase family protein, partial [Candidatus Freyarchaeota archaeon]
PSSPLGEAVTAGTGLFIASDSLIEVREFRRKLPHAALKILSTYYAAIFLISFAPLVYSQPPLSLRNNWKRGSCRREAGDNS